MKKKIGGIIGFIAIILLSVISTIVHAHPSLEGLNVDERVVALTILAEARGEGEIGMYAVSCVIQRRSIERRLTASEVCLQNTQFSCWDNVDMEYVEKRVLTKTNKKVLDYAKALSKVLVAGAKLDHSVVGRANHYCTTSINPYWSKGQTPTVVIGNHKFYRL